MGLVIRAELASFLCMVGCKMEQAGKYIHGRGIAMNARAMNEYRSRT